MISSSAEPSIGRDYYWIDTEEQLRGLAADLNSLITRGELTRVYLDTEADSLHHFQEKLCLIQLAANGIYALIDPLVLSDLGPLLEVVDNAEVWFHSADYDLTLLKRTCNWTPTHLKDTQVAARLTGHRTFGLAALVEQHCGVTLCKSSQKEDWSLRPLPAKMQAYAVDDVRYLGRLVDIFMTDLVAKDRVTWFEQSCESLRRDVLSRQEKDRDEAWRISGSGRLRPAGLAILREVWNWRDGIAREKDVPPFRVLNNQQMLTMATEFETSGTAHPPPRWRGRWKETFEAAVTRVKKADPASWPERPKKHARRMTDQDRAKIDRLCQARDLKAEGLGLETSLLGSRGLMEDLVLNPDGEVRNKLMAWQREVLQDVLSKEELVF
ncbi:ribonuclease D [Verrucomicrobium spinosum]|uniref:ribonuclease D n=1 Tax=Verrucomicrobium spinosum TaxID=2736 RepID=UPI0001746047|nr:ribonuclease D [Verrucomicrobium spinosum]